MYPENHTRKPHLHNISNMNVLPLRNWSFSNHSRIFPSWALRLHGKMQLLNNCQQSCLSDYKTPKSRIRFKINKKTYIVFDLTTAEISQCPSMPGYYWISDSNGTAPIKNGVIYPQTFSSRICGARKPQVDVDGLPSAEKQRPTNNSR